MSESTDTSLWNRTSLFKCFKVLVMQFLIYAAIFPTQWRCPFSDKGVRVCVCVCGGGGGVSGWVGGFLF
jgi:hypothetical protein